LQTGFQEAIVDLPPWPGLERRVDPLSTRPTQGRLRLHTALRPRRTDAPHCRFTICFVHGPEIPQREYVHAQEQVSTETGSVFHAIGKRPGSASTQARFPPAPTQNWAYQAGTTGFIGMPFGGFL